MNPTEEQLHAMNLAKKGGDLKLAAFAGAGKTTTLKLVAKELGRKNGIYLAFNKAIVGSLEGKLPENVEARTFHSLAYAKFGTALRHKLNSRLTGDYVANRLNLSGTIVETEAGERRQIRPATLGYYVIQCAQAYARWDGSDMPVKAFPYPDIRGLSRPVLAGLRNEYATAAIRLWALMADPSDSCPATHDVYVKQWVESRPQLRRDFLLFDEAQDADPLMIRLVQNQDSQKIWVGDQYQSIYTWRGAVNAMDRIEAQTAYLTQSFRFGEAVAERAQLVLWALGCKQRIRGFEGRNSRVEELKEYDAQIFRTNAAVIGRLIELHERGMGDRVSATGIDSAVNRLKAIQRLRDGGTAGGEFSLFKSYDELQEYANTPAGGDMLPLIKIERKYGAEKVIDLLNRSKAVRDPRLVLSVGHQAKGLEWSRVKMGADFLTPSTAAERQMAKEAGDPPPREPTDEENRLLYVCLTRAIDVLDDSNVDYRGFFERLGDLPAPRGREHASALDEAETLLEEGCDQEDLVKKTAAAISDVASTERRDLLARVASAIAIAEQDRRAKFE